MEGACEAERELFAMCLREEKNEKRGGGLGLMVFFGVNLALYLMEF